MKEQFQLLNEHLQTKFLKNPQDFLLITSSQNSLPEHTAPHTVNNGSLRLIYIQHTIGQNALSG